MSGMTVPARVSLVVLLVAFGVGCRCNEQTQSNTAVLAVLDAEDRPVTAVDFNLVQLNVTATQTLRLVNRGTGTLNVTALDVNAPFGHQATLPITVLQGQEAQLTLSFTPTVADMRVTDVLVVTSNDVSTPSYRIDVAGKGVTAVARASPNPIAFGDVYFGEPKTVEFTLTNTGGNALPVLGASLSSSLVGVTGDTGAFVTTIAPNGGSAGTVFTFAPTAKGALSGALTLQLAPMFGGALQVPVTGRGIVNEPKLCFGFDDTNGEVCASATNPTLAIDFGPVCDSAVFGPDAGAQACTVSSAQRTGHFFVRNDGNVAVHYSLRVLPQVPANVRCDGGTVSPPDFRFSNSPDAGGAFSTPTVALPLSDTEMMPWQSLPVAVSYRANSHCRLEATDQAQVFWSRQGEPTSRMPQTIVMTVTGSSRLPAAKEEPLNIGTEGQPQNMPLAASSPFYGVDNFGSAPLTVSSVALYEEVFDAGVPDAGGPLGGLLKACDPLSPGYEDSPCARFTWDSADGGDPSGAVPLTIAAATPAGPGRQVLGRLYAGCYADGGSCPTMKTHYRVYARIGCDDPYSPQVWAPIDAWVTQ